MYVWWRESHSQSSLLLDIPYFKWTLPDAYSYIHHRKHVCVLFMMYVFMCGSMCGNLFWFKIILYFGTQNNYHQTTVILRRNVRESPSPVSLRVCLLLASSSNVTSVWTAAVSPPIPCILSVPVCRRRGRCSQNTHRERQNRERERKDSYNGITKGQH